MFDGIIEFIAVAETQGFSSAAKRLQVSTSQISRAISDLEKRLGVALVARTTRRVNLTTLGQAYFEQCQDVLLSMEKANEVLSNEHLKVEGTLRVSAAGEFAELEVVPALLAFTEQHPDLKLDINFNTGFVDFVQDGFDIAIRYGELQDSNLIARRLARRTLVAAASDTYLQQHGIPQHPNDLLQHSCLIAATERWRFVDQGQTLSLKVQGKWRSNSGRSVVQACHKGLGIAYLPDTSYAGALERGELQPILAPYCQPEVWSWIVFANRRYLPLRTRLVIQHLLDWFAHWR